MSITGKYRSGCVSRMEVVEDEEDIRVDYVDFVDHEYARSNHDVKVGDYLYYLPHQCDSWMIGTEADVRRLIADLHRALSGSDDQAEAPPA